MHLIDLNNYPLIDKDDYKSIDYHYIKDKSKWLDMIANPAEYLALDSCFYINPPTTLDIPADIVYNLCT